MKDLEKDLVQAYEDEEEYEAKIELMEEKGDELEQLNKDL
jgi:hypothetical protein